METLVAWRAAELDVTEPHAKLETDASDPLVARLRALDAALDVKRKREREQASTARRQGPEAWALNPSEAARTQAAATKVGALVDDLLASKADVMYKLQRARDGSCVARGESRELELRAATARLEARRLAVSTLATSEHCETTSKQSDESMVGWRLADEVSLAELLEVSTMCDHNHVVSN
ncbi:Hypothetical Protein FCC1311_093532 [Hondaea fermentalgiana]|uniref:Uncharacterized protein n=1 Tax=Hondaea fermentalgiana TaxID=2315210 RepID=A0A2R5GS50_9STRA|nr:Hypothetical Protein FCC1311_093532 [Hondaea fermentalgiana]|eukprot:GBG33129.1 Hypothetical Protein FCC1311_093532 [Hondaea fermentalgiana]